MCDILLIALGPLAGTLVGRDHRGRPGPARRRLGRRRRPATPARCCRSLRGCRRSASCAPGRGRSTTGHRHRRSPPSTSPSARRSRAGTSRRCAARWSTQPILTYTLIGDLRGDLADRVPRPSRSSPSSTGPDLCSWGALPNTQLLPAVRAEPGCGDRVVALRQQRLPARQHAACTTCSSTASRCCSSAGWSSSCTDGSCCSERS